MSLINEEEKPEQTEKNEINNTSLKEQLTATALQMLTEDTNNKQFAHAECTFGYLFEIDGYGLEALFKITTTEGIFYFAAQQSSILKLSFNEELFQDASDTFLSLHQ